MNTRRHRWVYLSWSVVAVCAVACLILAVPSVPAEQNRRSTDDKSGDDSQVPAPADLQLATFGSGCFWCTEAVFERVKGVTKVVSGYSGGFIENPTYLAVCTGRTGHAEVTQIAFDPKQIKFEELLEIFWKTHDPTTLNQQGPDFGPQYRSVVFFHDEEQKKTATAYKQQLEESHAFKRPIVTEISPFTKFYPAEKKHQDYYELNGRAPYCRQQIRPKIIKFNRQFRDKLKNDK